MSAYERVARVHVDDATTVLEVHYWADGDYADETHYTVSLTATYPVWVGTDRESYRTDTVDTPYALTLAELRAMVDALGAIVADLEREAQP
jgi:hypothetical protein